jgi:hypothetical protein
MSWVIFGGLWVWGGGVISEVWVLLLAIFVGGLRFSDD